MPLFAGAAAVLAAVVLGAAAGLAADEHRDAQPAPGGALSVPGARSDAHRRLFTPLGAPPGAYIVTVLPSPMAEARQAVMRALGVEAPPAGPVAPAPLGHPWAVRRLEAAEAFGTSGTYEPVRLARLFNGRRAEVCRGPVIRGGEVVASVTLISPYPDPFLSRLVSGTLVLVLVLRV